MTSTGELIGRRVGRFKITSHLASGGMAELFVARQEAVGGFAKDLVLKMLQERYARNSRVVDMFLTEARLAAKLNHQNIVHVYDVDEAEGIRYIAMEYIHGETITDIIRRGIARGGFLPLEHAIHIIAETAAGLAYAHDCRDATGQPARIVHRDVSPSNILVTYEGLTKIVDFGIARVQDQILEESGMRPGKVSYMSPEQVRGEATDHRSDIFSLGIILYEITVGRRLWRGPPEVVMRRIVEEQIPPPTYVRREYPPGLELIVMKTLERRPADRYRTAAELQHDLNEFMEDAGLKSGAHRLSQYMKELFGAATGVDPGAAVEANAFGDGTGSSADEQDDAEELDFDRRAPLIMRVEARAGEAAPTPRTHAPVSPLSRARAAPSAAKPGFAVSEPPHAAVAPLTAETTGSVRANAAVDLKPFAGRGIPTVSGGAGEGAGEGAETISAQALWDASEDGAKGLEEPDGAEPGAAVEAGSGAVSGLTASGESPRDEAVIGIAGAGVRWALLLLLAGVVAVVFLITR